MNPENIIPRLLELNVDLPYVRPMLARRRVIRVEVGKESMRCGGTSAVKAIVEGLNAKGISASASYEEWEGNPHLQASYLDDPQAFLESQKWFAKRKWEQIKEARESSEPVEGVCVVVQDVHPEGDFAYAVTRAMLGQMSNRNLREYAEFFRGLGWELSPFPDLLVYLTADDKTLVERAEASRRPFETFDDHYILTMKKVNRAWLVGAEKHHGERILRIDTNRMDFAHDKAAKQALVRMVGGRLQKGE